MTLLFMDGFDHYATAQLGYKWDDAGGNVAVSGSYARYGAGGLRVPDNNGSSGRVSKYVGDSSRLTAGCAFYWVNKNVLNNYRIISFCDGGPSSYQVEMRLNTTSQQLNISRNSTLLGTGTTVIQVGAWYYLEFQSDFSGSAGSPIIRVNGVEETISWVTGSGTTQWTNGQGTTTADWVMFGPRLNSITYDIDDVYVLNSSGSTNNDFLGDSKVETIFPSGNGNSSQWVGSDADSTDNYLLVDEATPSTSDYVDGSNAGDKDTYAFGDLTTTSGTVYGVQVVPYAAKTDAGTRSIASVARLSGTEVDSANKSLGNTETYYPDVRETKPGGGAWTISDVNSAEFGVKVVA